MKIPMPCDRCGWWPWECTCRGARDATPTPKLPRKSWRGIARSRR